MWNCVQNVMRVLCQIHTTNDTELAIFRNDYNNNSINIRATTQIRQTATWTSITYYWTIQSNTIPNLKKNIHFDVLRLD